MRRAVILLGLALPFLTPALAAERDAQALATSQGAIGSTLPALAFTAVDGKQITLAELRGRPLLLTLIYTGCADVCPTVVENLVPAVAAGEEALGKESFDVAVIGFDTRNDMPSRMRSFARDHGVQDSNWHFLSGDAKALDALTAAVGFSYFSAAGGYDHTAQVTVIDHEGRIYRQIYGSTFEAPQIVEPLKELVFGRRQPLFSLAGLSDRVKLFCTVYNPRTGRYYFNYSLFAEIVIGALSLAGVGFVLVRETRRTLRSGGGG